MNYRKLISVDSAKRGGRPCIRDLRISVFDILESLASGMSVDDITAALSFAADRERHIGELRAL